MNMAAVTHGERRDIAALVPYARNARKHSPEQVAQLMASIREFGWTIPVLIDDAGGIIAGHGRVMAAQGLGLTEVPVLVARGWSDAKKRAYIIADNKLTLNAEWDDEILSRELADLRLEGMDMSLTGFSNQEIDALLRGAVVADPEDIPPPPVVAITRPGDIWLLGPHRIICGSATDPATVAALLGQERPHLMVTDPPYGVEYDPTKTSNNAAKAGKVLNDDRADWTEAWRLFPGEAAYVWHASMFTDVVLKSLEDCGLQRRSMIIWAKDRMTLGRGHYHWQHEPAWYVVRKGGNARWAGGRDKTTIWNIKAREDEGHGHGTQKPVECMKRPIENNSAAGDLIYEPFSGSGTTIIAGEMTGRKVRAIELSPAYVDVAVMRWQQYTDDSAYLESSGRTFEEVKAKRAKEAVQ